MPLKTQNTDSRGEIECATCNTTISDFRGVPMIFGGGGGGGGGAEIR